ncbi:SAM-dependent methyltransferase [Pelagibacteraceae bacterium]|nr:SAM-dependent methyltransferase [Pelagibacteraceae bacterium]
MKVKELIITKINKEGRINVAQFIEFCQYSNNGYYIKNNPIGKKNDFVTAPEISQMFGEILATFIINYWNENIKTEFNLIELGPGTGTLIRDILRTADVNKNFLDAAYLILIEKNQTLKYQQKKNLNNLNFIKAKWVEEFNIKNTRSSIIYSNEFFDCFPVRQFYKKNKWYERYINYNKTQKIFNFESQEVKNQKILSHLEKFNSVKVAEISESRKKYFESICQYIKKNKGIFITIDYGYKKPQSYLSLQTIYNHNKTHLFENIGSQDITAHVNFDEFYNIAYKYELKIDLYCTQKDFLIGFGLKERKKKLQKNKSEKAYKKIEFDYERLTDKTQMGEIFKVLVISCI